MSTPTPDDRPVCWQCSGTKIMFVEDRYGSGDADVCDMCNGTGYKLRNYT